MSQLFPDNTYDAIIVLGARVYQDGTASDALSRRLTLAHACYLQNPVPIICCGAQGHNEPCAEADFMCRWLTEQGVPVDRVIPEDTSFDTLQNIANARAIMNDRGYRRALVVTSDYHVRRALAICRRYKVSARGVGSPSDREYWLKNHAREVLAWGKFVLTLLSKR